MIMMRKRTTEKWLYQLTWFRKNIKISKGTDNGSSSKADDDDFSSILV